MLSFVGARVPHFFKFSKQMTIILLSSYGYPETSVIQKINFSVPPHSPKKMQNKTRSKAKAQSLVRSSASGELQGSPPQGDGGVTGRCRLGHGEGSERRFRSSRTSKPRPGKAPPRRSPAQVFRFLGNSPFSPERPSLQNAGAGRDQAPGQWLPSPGPPPCSPRSGGRFAPRVPVLG